MKKGTKNDSKNPSIIYLIIKRLIDVICGIIGLIVLIPITIIIKVVSVLNGDFGSVFFTQNRIGLNGKEFKFYKYRTMVPNADEKLFKLLEENEEAAAEYKIHKKLKNDPRITKIGKILRKTSIDELPQLINVLIGDMSLIGNRPYLPREKEDMGEYFDEIVKSKPGLTGYWQVSGRSDTTFANRLNLESYYSNHMSLWMDIKIFFKTFGAVIFGHGAE